MFKSLVIISILFSTIAYAKNDKSKDCSFACKSIPPMSESYLELGRAESEVLPSQNLNILVWNIYKGRKATYATDFKKITAKKHILLLQEVVFDEPMIKSFNDLGNYLFGHAISFYLKNEISTGVATGSVAVPLLAVHQRTVDDEPFLKSPKTNLVNMFQLDDGQKLLTINIHGINITDTITLERQLQQAESFIKNHNGPTIFAGDFNTRNSDRQKMTDAFFKKLGMTLAVLKNDKRKKKLDHFYYKNLVVSAELISNLKGSDHPAIVATVSTQ